MTAPLTASERDLRTLAAIVSEERTDLPEGGGLPRSLLADLTGQIRCDVLALNGLDSGRQLCWFSQDIPRSGDRFSDAERQALDQAFWSSRFRTSTRLGSGTPPACTAISPGDGPSLRGAAVRPR